MKEIILDGKEMTSKVDAYEYISKQMGFPKYFGNNLDALYDVLSVWSEKTNITIINCNYFYEGLGEYALRVIDVFKEVEEENSNILLKIL